jgi:hypothetical protein
VVLSYKLGPRTPLGCSARKWVESFSGLQELDEPKRLTVESLKTLQTADKKKKKAVDEQVFREWVLPKIPNREPTGRLISRAEQIKIADYCYAIAKKFYGSCPAMAVEDKLSEIRPRDPNRKSAFGFP